jgi:hypothetical protein
MFGEHICNNPAALPLLQHVGRGFSPEVRAEGRTHRTCEDGQLAGAEISAGAGMSAQMASALGWH